MSKLTFYPVTDTHELVRPEQSMLYDMSSPAIHFFTDFHTVHPKIIRSSVSAQQALNTMIKTHVRMMLVVDTDRQFLGMVTAQDVSEQNIITTAVQQHEKPEDVPLTDLMKRKQDLLALRFKDIQDVNIGEIVEFLQDNHSQHCLVIDSETTLLRGIFSASDISRKLQLPINIQEQSSFSKVFSATR